MAQVWIPWLLRRITGGQLSLAAEGRTIGQVIEALDEVYPGLKAGLCPDGKLDPHLSVSVDGRMTRLGLEQPVQAASEIRFFPMVEGG